MLRKEGDMNKIDLYRRLAFLLLYTFLFFTHDSLAADRVLDPTRLDNAPRSLTEYFAVLEDSTRSLALADVQKPEIGARFVADIPSSDALNLGYTQAAVWLRLTLRNDSDTAIERMLEIGNARISSVEFYQPSASTAYDVIKTGLNMPFASRPKLNRYYIFPLKLPAHTEQVYFLRFQSLHSLNIPARLWEPQAFQIHERNDYIVQAMYFGIVTAMLLYNLILFFALRDIIYLQYVNFVIFFSLSLASENGLAKEFLWPESGLWSDISTPVGYAISFATLLIFMRRMLNTNLNFPQLDAILKPLIYLYFILPVAFAFSLDTFIKPSAVLYLSTAALMLAIGLFGSYKRHRSAYFFLAAFAVLTLAAVITVLTYLGFFNSNILTTNSLQFGSAIEMLLLALALGDRINLLRKETTNAQNEALKAQSSLIEALKISEKQLEAYVAERTAELRIAATAFESHECSVVTDARGIILKVNPAFHDITGYRANEVIGKTLKILHSGRHNADFYSTMWDSINKTGIWQGEIWNRHKNGELYPKWLTISAVKADDGSISNYVGTHQDITERKVAEERIAELAFFDPLTRLPNRTLLKDRLKQAMNASKRADTYSSVLLIDLDQFKTLNDTLGHEKGDQLLQMVAQRLLKSVREGDTIARLGGDEFVVVLCNLHDNVEEAANKTEQIAEKILSILTQPYQFEDHDYHSTASIGATLFKGHETSIDELLKQADLAMYKSKDTGRNSLHFFDQVMETVVVERVALETALRKAIQEKEFLLHYQAQIIGMDHINGAEVLVRWRHPQLGMISPGDFIPLAEETGLIIPLGHWVLETACAQLAVWATQPEMAHLTLAVNVSAHQFHQPDFVAKVLELLKVTNTNPSKLKLELTESLLVENIDDIIKKMNQLIEHGVRFSLDDFGTGYSSLSYLKRLPLFQLKIDQSFVREILVDPNDAAIAKTIVALAQSLGLQVIAEGVETEAQRDFLAAAGCLAYQGYLFSRPLPIAEFEAIARRI